MTFTKEKLDIDMYEEWISYTELERRTILLAVKDFIDRTGVRHGFPCSIAGCRLIPLSQKQFALVDEEDYADLMAYKWSSGRGYATTYLYEKQDNGKLKSRNVAMHRLVLGDKPEFYVDHINGNTLDNRKSNLRYVTNSQNQMNKRPLENKSSKYKGVSWMKKEKRWKAYIGKDMKLTYLGSFVSERHAAEAYNLAATEYFGEFAKLNVFNEEVTTPQGNERE